MLTYIVRRLLVSIPTIVFVSIVVFGLQLLLPGDPALALAGVTIALFLLHEPLQLLLGARGARVRNIVKELGGEKIDIIRYHKEPLKLLEEAIRPARPRNVRIDERNRSIHFEVEEEDMRIAIGSKGRNARLTSKLMGWGLNIAKAIHGHASVEEELYEGEKPVKAAVEQRGWSCSYKVAIDWD